MIEAILKAIGTTEPINFAKFCHGLGDQCPEKGDTIRWSGIFSGLRNAEALGLILVTRIGKDIDTLRLTEAGADRIRARLDAARELFKFLEQSGGNRG